MPSTSSYPASLDSFTNPTDTLGGPNGNAHDDAHRHLNDAVLKLETALGTNPAGTAASVAARLAATEAAMTGPTAWTAYTAAVFVGGATAGSVEIKYAKAPGGRIYNIDINTDVNVASGSGALEVALPFNIATYRPHCPVRVLVPGSAWKLYHVFTSNPSRIGFADDVFTQVTASSGLIGFRVVGSLFVT